MHTIDCIIAPKENCIKTLTFTQFVYTSIFIFNAYIDPLITSDFYVVSN